MRLIPSDPDVQTIVSRIRNGDIKLQPDFQRGEVWSDSKKKRLIDSILREWHVPPIHLIDVKENGRQEVLDGQQRLAAIRDFVNGKIRIDGGIAPPDDTIINLDGLSYFDLPDSWRRRFDNFTIRVFRIIDYKPEEPGELFFRLNQPTNLTAAEQRNAFYGPAREQIKDLVSFLVNSGLTADSLGFSNSRMSYDDTISRFCYTLELGTFTEKVTSTNITNKYRSQKPFDDYILNRARDSINCFSIASKLFNESIRFNKATLYSWLCFIDRLQRSTNCIDPEIIGRFIGIFELMRLSSKQKYKLFEDAYLFFKPFSYNSLIELFQIYNDRASSRVADTTSVIIRDIVLWITFIIYYRNKNVQLLFNNMEINNLTKHIECISNESSNIFDLLMRIITETNWGLSL